MGRFSYPVQVELPEGGDRSHCVGRNVGVDSRYLFTERVRKREPELLN